MAPNTNLKDIMTKTPTTDFFIACKESRIESNTSFYGCFYLGPFDESLSQTLANDLRRTLLSELTGLAITSVEIEGVLHKFSSLPGMKESVLDLICNLQNIVLKKQESRLDSSLLSVKRSTKKTYMGFLNANGPRVIKAMDLKLPAGLQCVDPNQYIATLAEDGVLNMKFNINEGKNFIKQKQHNLDVTTLKKRNILLQNFKKKINLPANTVFYTENKNKKLSSVGTDNWRSISNPIPLDAVFMPVTKINCIIEENNIYSDFSTDYANRLTETSSRIPNQINNKTLSSFFHFIDSNSIYQTTAFAVDGQRSSNMLLKNSNKNTFGQSQKNVFDNKFKLIPWHSNSFYFNVNDATFNQEDTSNTNVSKIRTFLGSKPSLIFKKTVSIKVPNGLFYSLKNKKGELNTAFPVDGQQPSKDVRWPKAIEASKLTTISQKSQALLNSDTVSRYYDIKTGLKEHSKTSPANYGERPSTAKTVAVSKYQINTVSGLNQEIINLEYAKILKLKPLRKKSNLILEIWTNGSLHPRQALAECFTFLSNNFLKLQTVKMMGSMFKSELSYGNIKYSYLSNYNQPKMRALSVGTNNWRSLDAPSEDLKMANIFRGEHRFFKTTATPRVMLPTSGVFENLNLQQNMLKRVSINSTELQKITRINQINPILQASLKAPVGILKISLRAYTALKKAGIFTIKDLLNKSKTDLLKIKNLGIKSVSEIETSLAYLGLTLKNVE